MANCGNDLGSKLLNNFENIGDVTFSVGPEKEEIKSSVFILRTLSPVFDKMFNENWNSQQSKVELPDIQPEVFRHFLKLLLTYNLTLKKFDDLKLTIEEILHMLYIANKYDVQSVPQICRDSIMKRTEIGTAVLIYETVQNMNEPELEEVFLQFIARNIDTFVEEDSFTKLSRESLTKILKCEHVEIDELELFNGIYRWAELQCTNSGLESNGQNIRSAMGEILFLLRFPVMSLEPFFEIVHPKEILSADEVAEICHSMALKGKPSFKNKCPFSVKDRMKSKKKKQDISKYGQCVKFCPKSRISLTTVAVQGIDHYSHALYFIRFYISGENLNYVCHETMELISGSRLNTPFEIEMEPPVILEKDNVYDFHFDFERRQECEWTESDSTTMTFDSTLKLKYIKFEAIP